MRRLMTFFIIGLLLIAGVGIAGCTSEPASAPATPVSTPVAAPVATIPKVTSESVPQRTNVDIVEEIVRSYHETHTYMGPDIFVCGDMAMDVWNMVETEGINAEIMIGDPENPRLTDLSKVTHAWVLAEVSPGKWVALETTGGFISYDDGYYRGWSFESPREMRTYLSLIKQLNTQLKVVERATNDYNQKVSEYNSAVNRYNELSNQYSRYAGRTSSNPYEIQAAMDLYSQINAQGMIVSQRVGELNQATNNLNNANRDLEDIYFQMNNLFK